MPLCIVSLLKMPWCKRNRDVVYVSPLTWDEWGEIELAAVIDDLFPGHCTKIKDKELLCPWDHSHLFNTVVLTGQAASTSPGNLWRMPVLASYPRPTESEGTLRVEPSNCVLRSTPGDLRQIKVWNHRFNAIYRKGKSEYMFNWLTLLFSWSLPLVSTIPWD